MKPLLRTPLALLGDVADWNGYLKALEQCDLWWRSRFKGKYSVLGESSCWEETIRELHVVVKKNWERLAEDEKKRLLGLRGVDEEWALLGRMRQPGFNAIFLDENNRRIVQGAISEVVVADCRDFPDVAVGAYREITRIKHVGHGIATRLLALARPDYIVSFNNESRDGLAEYFGLFFPQGQLRAEKYRSLLESLYEKPWFNVPQPENPRESGIWSMRAALIDCFVYSGEGGPV